MMAYVQVPKSIQHHTMYDGSVAVNQKDAKDALEQLINNTISVNTNFADLDRRVAELEKFLNRYTQFVEQQHPGTTEAFFTTTAVISRIEGESNGSAQTNP